MKLFKISCILSAIFSLVFFASSCVKDEFDAPPSVVVPDIETNATIADIVALIEVGSIVEIDTNLVFKAVVTGNDVEGNFFRELIMEDETGGISILINLTDAYTFFPLGREVFVKTQGLFVTEDNLTPQLGGYIQIQNGGERLGAIQELNDVLVRGRLNQNITPLELTITELNPDIHSARLIRLNNVEFANPSETFADAVGGSSQSKDLEDCTGNELVVRTSGFASFAGTSLPDGNGSIVGIYSSFNGTDQIFIRSLDDVATMTGLRCDGTSGGGGTGTETQISIQELKDIYNGGGIAGPDDTKIRGVVISDRANENTPSRNLHLQDGDAGIIIRFNDNHNFNLNDVIEVVVSNQELSEFNGGLQVNEVSNNLATFIEEGTSPTPRTATVAEILANNDEWESTLVRIVDATIGGDSNYRFNEITDATGTMDMFTQSFASFTNQSVPTGSVDVVGILSEFNEPQITIRNTDDVTEGSGGGGGGGNDPEQISLETLRNSFNSGATAVPADRFVRGIVISDQVNGNFNNQNMVIQDGEYGIVVRFTEPHSFDLGDEVEVNVSQDELSEFNGLLQINNVNLADAMTLSSSNTVAPRIATIGEVIANSEEWESTVVELEDVSLSGNAIFDGSITVSDGTGSLMMFTRSGASFANAALPSGEVVMTAVVTQFTDVQVFIRNLDDIN